MSALRGPCIVCGDERVRAMKRATYRVALEEIRRFTRASALLDVGCALGFLLEEAVEHGFEACGVDQNAEVARLARERFGDRVWTGALGAEAFLGRDFDVMTLFDVLEHVPDPADLL